MKDLTAADIMRSPVFTEGRRLGSGAGRAAGKEKDQRHTRAQQPEPSGGYRPEGDLVSQGADIHFPHYIELLGNIIYLESIKKYEEKLEKAAASLVKDIATTEVITAQKRRRPRNRHPPDRQEGKPVAGAGWR